MLLPLYMLLYAVLVAALFAFYAVCICITLLPPHNWLPAFYTFNTHCHACLPTLLSLLFIYYYYLLVALVRYVMPFARLHLHFSQRMRSGYLYTTFCCTYFTGSLRTLTCLPLPRCTLLPVTLLPPPPFALFLCITCRLAYIYHVRCCRVVLPLPYAFASVVSFRAGAPLRAQRICRARCWCCSSHCNTARYRDIAVVIHRTYVAVTTDISRRATPLL